MGSASGVILCEAATVLSNVGGWTRYNSGMQIHNLSNLLIFWMIYAHNI